MPVPSPARGWSPAEWDQFREGPASGRGRKAVFPPSAGQIAGQQGQVVELTDPTGSDEWVVVRFGRDELPFSPADLAVPPKAPAKPVSRRAGAAAGAVPGQPRAGRGDPAPVSVEPSVETVKEPVMP